mmetsp:Transcript_7201/g.16426  ORF Transcript_7201/g.16426 Transcript_7201/m.16426 type:complete len:274 (-) Transcript_7201:1339-2160(-)
MRTLVHHESRTNAVTRSMPVIETTAPERRARQRIKEEPRCTRGKHHVAERDMALQHPCVAVAIMLKLRAQLARLGVAILANFIRLLSKVHGARNIRGTAVKLRAGVKQQHIVASDGQRGLLGCTVVDDGSVRIAPRDRWKAWLEETLLLASELGDQHLVDCRLVNVRASIFHNLTFEPAEKSRKSGAVAKVSLLHTAEFGVVLQSLERNDGRRVLHQNGVMCLGIELSLTPICIFLRRRQLFVATLLRLLLCRSLQDVNGGILRSLFKPPANL